MDLFLYLDRGTWAHQLDPRVKVLGTGAFFLVALLFSDPRYLIMPTALMLVLIAAAGAWDNVRKLWLLVALPFFYCLLLWPFFVTGRTPWLSLGSHLIAREAAEFGLGMGLRLTLMVLGGILLLSTSTVEEFTLALQRLGLPATMGFALSLAFRWVPGLIGAAGLIVQAQRSRGLDVGAGHMVDRLRRYPPLLVPLIGHTLRHTRFLAMALESKGFGPGVRRQELVEFRLRMLDYAALVLIALVVILCLWLRLAGYGSLDVHF